MVHAYNRKMDENDERRCELSELITLRSIESRASSNESETSFCRNMFRRCKCLEQPNERSTAADTILPSRPLRIACNSESRWGHHVPLLLKVSIICTAVVYCVSKESALHAHVIVHRTQELPRLCSRSNSIFNTELKNLLQYMGNIPHIYFTLPR